MVVEYNVIIEKIRNIAIDNGIMKHNVHVTQESDTGGTIVLRSGMYDILIDIGDNQEYYRLATSKCGYFNGYDDEKNIVMVKTLRGVSGYIRRYTD